MKERSAAHFRPGAFRGLYTPSRVAGACRDLNCRLLHETWRRYSLGACGALRATPRRGPKRQESPETTVLKSFANPLYELRTQSHSKTVSAMYCLRYSAQNELPNKQGGAVA